MHRVLRPAALVPTGLVVQSSALDGDQVVITVRAASEESICPACRLPARRVHSRYLRQLQDLPLAGRAVRLLLLARRFRCNTANCPQQNFTERSALKSWSLGHAEPSAWTSWSTSSVWPWVVVQRQT
jgi:transposase